MDRPTPTTLTAQPSLDAVFFRLTYNAERDYVERSVFPALRNANAPELGSSGSLHFLSQDDAEEVLEDARARYQSAYGKVRSCYGALARNLSDAVEEAKKRPAIFAAPTAVQTYRSDYTERWRGTKEQLRAVGFQLDGPWPREPGGKRWAKIVDSDGRSTHLTRFHGYDHWPHLFEADVTLPQEAPTPREDPERKKKLARARAELDAMPKSAEDFRWECIEDMRRWVQILMKHRSTKNDGERFHGYSFTEGAVEQILLSMDGLEEAIDQAEVNFDAAFHREIHLRRQHDVAALDPAFQATLSALMKPNPKLLEGRPS